MALLITSILLTSLIPIITQRQKAHPFETNIFPVIPVGTIAIWMSEIMPDGTWMECAGQKVPDDIRCSQLRKVVGANVSNLQGMFIRGFGTQTIAGLGTYSSGELGQIQMDAIRNFTGTFGASSTGWMGVSSSGIIYNAGKNGWCGGAGNCWDCGYCWGFNVSRVVPTAEEFRPVSIAVKYIIKARI